MSAIDQILGTSAREREALAARIARHLPPPLIDVFNPDVMCSHLLFDELVHRLTLNVCAESGLAEAASHWGTVDEMVARSGFDPGPATAAVGSILGSIMLARLNGQLEVQNKALDAAQKVAKTPPADRGSAPSTSCRSSIPRSCGPSSSVTTRRVCPRT